MSTLDLVIVVVGVLTLAALVLEHLRQRAELAAVRQGAGFSGYDLELAVAEAIRRTDPDVGPELAERLAATVIEDLAAGHLYPTQDGAGA